MGRRELLRSGVGHVPQDRTGEGLVGDFTVAENLMLDLWNAPPYAERGRLRFDEIKRRARADVEQFDIRTPDVDTVVSTLSGGNQQKVVVAREFTGDNALLVCAPPTRGVDVGSIEYIHGTIVAQRDAGTAVLLVSSELDEVIALSDRIGVMYRGRLLGPFPTPIAKEAVGRMMAGADPQDVLGDTSEH
jgi:simple sugar transport system ATP-binding protein